MRRRRASSLIVVLAAIAGCSGSSHGGGGFFVAPSPSPSPSPKASPSPTPTPSPSPSPPPVGSQGQSQSPPPGPTPSPSPAATTLAITSVRAPRVLQPGEGHDITWSVVSSSSVTRTFVRWGTASGQLDQTTPSQTATSSGLASFVQAITAPRAQGTIFFAIEADDMSGAHAATSEGQIQVLWANPPGALLASVTSELAIPDDSTNGLDVPLAYVDSGTVASVRVRVDITHPRRGDLALSLSSPSGRSARLLAPSSDPNPDVFGTFGDTLGSLDDLDATFAGAQMQGTWTLHVADTVPAEVGTIHSATLLIQLKGPPGGETLPNIVTVPLTDFSIGVHGTDKALRFSYTAANLGPGPFDFHGVKDSTGTTQAYQRIYAATRDSSGALRWELVREKLVGQMFFDVYDKTPHYNYNQFALYELLDTHMNQIRTSDKISFCIDDVAIVDSSVPNFSSERVYWCGLSMQGLSPGWADTYAAACDRQWIKITDVPDGDYYVVAEATHAFDEAGPTDRSDNDGAAHIAIAGTTVTLLEWLDGPTLAARRAAAASGQ